MVAECACVGLENVKKENCIGGGWGGSVGGGGKREEIGGGGKAGGINERYNKAFF